MINRVVITLLALTLLSLTAAPGDALAGEHFTVSRLVVGTDIVDREPVGVAESFPASTETVYCFLEAQDVAEDTEIAFVWFYDDQEVAMVTLPIRKGDRWRTFSSKRLAGRKGLWRVELRDESGETVKAVRFTVR